MEHAATQHRLANHAGQIFPSHPGHDRILEHTGETVPRWDFTPPGSARPKHRENRFFGTSPPRRDRNVKCSRKMTCHHPLAD